MASEDYQIDGVNISVLARESKRFYNSIKLDKAKKELLKYDIEFNVRHNGIHFIVNNEKYVYHQGKNRVYKNTKNTDLTLNKFIKENKEYFIERNTDDIFEFGKYIGKSIDDVITLDLQYIEWLIKNFKPNESNKEFFDTVIEHYSRFIERNTTHNQK